MWSLLPGPAPDLGQAVSVGPTGIQSAFAVDEAVRTSTAAAALAIAELGSARGLNQQHVAIDGQTAAASFATHLEINGVAPPTWADLSGYYTTGDDRQIQFHCNFAHHAAGVVDLLGCGPERESVEAAVRGWHAQDLESALIDRGMIAAKLRTMNEWDGHPHAQATNALPLLHMEQIGDAAPRAREATTSTALEGVRALDCSRVLAGPVAGQILSAHGADVLRVSSPNLPSVQVCVQATGAGKRNCFVDLDTDAGLDDMATLLGGADVWIDAYRPDAFANRGFCAERAATLSPGIVVLQLSAFDWVGPWSGRRGFDSIIQSTTGLVDAGSRLCERDVPTPLPVQALDHATGHLAAFAAARALLHQANHGGSWLVRLSLLRTRNWLVGLGDPKPFQATTVEPGRGALMDTDSSWGTLTMAKPPTGSWATPPMPLGSSTATWLRG